MKKTFVLLALFLLFSATASYAQKWVDMGTKADNGAPMYWSSYDLVKNKISEWELAKVDTIIGAETSWSLGNFYDSPCDIAGSKSDDLATNTLGKPYRMPSKREFERLINNCYVTFHSKKVKNGYYIQPKDNGVSWIYGSWELTTGGFVFKLYINRNKLTWTSWRPGLDPFPETLYEGSYTIKMDKIVMGNAGLYFPISLNRKRIYTPKGEAFHNNHQILCEPMRIPDKWLDYVELQSKTNGNIIVFPIEKHNTDEDLAFYPFSYYLKTTNKKVSWWTSSKTNDNNVFTLTLDGDEILVEEKSSSNNFRIRPVYDDGHKNPSRYPNDFGWLQMNVDWFSECGLDIYLDDSLVGSAPYHKEYKIKCGSHKVRITGDRIDDFQRSINIGYRETCVFHPTITSKYARVTIRANDCEIQIDGKNVGHYSWTGELEAGKYKVKVTKACYEPYEETINVVGGRNATFEITPKHLKIHNLKVSCNADNCKVLLNGKRASSDSNTPLSLNLEMQTSHTLHLEAPNYVPITITFSILEYGIVLKSSSGLDSYDGDQSYVVKSDLNGLDIHLCKLNKRSYYGNNNLYKQRPNYKGPIMGVDKIRVNGMSIGSETAWRNEYYWKSRFMFSWSLGLALMYGNEEDPLAYYGDIGYRMPVDFIGLSVGWQVLRGAGLRVTPQIGAIGCSILFWDPIVLLGAKVSIAYPLTDRFVVGVTPMIGLFAIDGIENPDFGRYTCFGVSMNLGWQKY